MAYHLACCTGLRRDGRATDFFVPPLKYAFGEPYATAAENSHTPTAFNYAEERLPYQVELFVFHAEECHEKLRVDRTLLGSLASI